MALKKKSKTTSSSSAVKPRTLDQFSDAELAQMVRNSIYVQNTRFGAGKRDAQYLIVFAVPYGTDDGVTDLAEALDSFQRLLADDDWRERSFEVYDRVDGYFTVQRETLTEGVAL